MSYVDDYKFKEVWEELYNAFAALGFPVYIESRPEATTEPMDAFILLTMPNNMQSPVFGGGYGNVSTFLTVEVFTRMKATGIVDVPKEAENVRKVMGMFPINGTYAKVSQPRPQLKGIDATGFSVTLIRTRIILK